MTVATVSIPSASALKIPSKEVASNIDADGLNKYWDELTQAYDLYYDSIAKANQDVLKKAISDWQDFYFGNMGIWLADDVTRWRTIYSKTAEALAAAIPLGAKPQTPENATTQASKTDVDAVFYVTGKTSPTVIKDVMIPQFASAFDLSSPRWLGLAALGLLGAAFMFGSKRKKR